ncbi:MAG TPA: DUF92 domain-containing protein [Gemmatimonadaceae bacterium]
MLARFGAGLLVAGAIACAAWRAGSLSASGAVAATLVGGASVAGGWQFGALLIAYFIVASALSALGSDAKARRTGAIVEKGGARDAAQVLANGGVFAALALATTAAPTGGVLATAAVGALAASSADTWGTEIGTLYGGDPRSVLTWRIVPAGSSGAVSVVGSLAMVAGATFVAFGARLVGLATPVVAVAAGGTFGAVVDSLIGARLQERRWCESCERQTERRVHDCGHPTVCAGGVSWMTNDAVNLLATLTGAAATAAFVTL